MRLEGVELRKVDLRLRRPVGTSAGTHRERPVVFVRVVCDGLEGWGECGALAHGTAVDPTVDQVWGVLAGGMVERLLQAALERGGDLPEASQLGMLDRAGPAERMASAAIEMAVLDAELSAAGASLAESLGVAGRRVEVGAMVGIPADRDMRKLLEAVAAAVSAGFRRVRLKIEPGWDLEPVRAVRHEHPELALQVDANGAYLLGSEGRDDARRLIALDPFALNCIEQPLSPNPLQPDRGTHGGPGSHGEPDSHGDLELHAALAELLATPVCLDESLTTPHRVLEAIEYGACEVACLKPARLGGLLAAHRAHDTCLAAGIPAFVGGFFETGLARSANAAVAALPGFTMAGDLSDPAGYLQEDPCRYEEPQEGWVRAPMVPGVGPHPRPEILAARTVTAEWLSCLRRKPCG